MRLAQADTEGGADTAAEPAVPAAEGEAPATAADTPAAAGADDGVIGAVEHELDDHAHGPSPLLAPEVFLLLALIATFAVVWRPAKRAVLGLLDGRADKIRAELDNANRLKEEAQATLAGYQRRQRDALEEAERIVEHARQEADRLRKQAVLALEEQLQRREAQAMERIAQAERAAAAAVRDAASDAAIAAARQVIADTLDTGAAARLIDDAIGELPGKLN